MGNRIIKFEYGFSAKDKTIKKVYHLHEIPNIQNICDVWNDLPIKYVRQFTGVQDVNGNDIYDGDIVQPTKFNDNPSLVEFITNGFYRVKMHGEKYYINPLGNCEVEIIGNKFESELLTTK